MGIGAYFSAFFLTPVCASCRELRSVEGYLTAGDPPLCDVCRKSWEEEKRKQCPVCGRGMSDCECLPPLLSDCEAIPGGVFLTGYRSGGGSVPDRILYRIKQYREKEVFAFLAKELLPSLERVTGKTGPAGDLLITALPRRKSAIREYGFDQAVALAKALSEETGYPYRTLLCRTGRAREQKTLSLEERLCNMRNAFRYAGPDLRGKRVILVDDLITTGSGMRAGADLLWENGASSVIPCVIAKTLAR